MFFLSCRVLKKHIWTTMFTVVQIMLSLIALSTLSVFIFDNQNNVRAIKELPTENVYILTAFPYYDLSFVENEIQNTPGVDLGKVSCIPNVTVNEKICDLVVYDRIIIERYAPSLAHGNWLTECSSPEDDKIPAVVTADMGLKVGDCLTVALSSDAYITISVEGILKKPTQYLFPESYADPAYFKADMIISNDPAIIISSEHLTRISEPDACPEHPPKLMPMKSCFIFSKGEALETAGEGKFDRLGKITPASDLISLYKSNMKDLIGAQTIIFLVFLQLAVTGVFSCYVIQAHRNRKMFTVYYLLGMDWKQAIMIESMRNILIVLIIMTLSFVLWKLGLIQLYWLNKAQIISFFLIVLAYIGTLFAFVSAIYLRKLIHEDVSVSLKDLQQWE